MGLLASHKDTELKSQFQRFTCNKTLSLSLSLSLCHVNLLSILEGISFYPSQQMELELVLSF